MAPEDILNAVEEAQDRAAATLMIPGEPVLGTKLAPRNAGRGLAALVPKGMRAYTIQTSRVTASVAGFVLPGNRVDVLLNLKGCSDDKTGGGSTTTLLQSVEILAVDQRLDAPSDNKVNLKELSSVTLLVTPEQAALLDLGQNAGQLTLALRNPEDNASALARPALLANIRFRQEEPKPAPSPPRQPPPDGSPKKPRVYEIVTWRGEHRGQVLVTVIP
jgi:pilus assembly protein CpaB